jgi:HAD superfamily hydrolase (TIGR01509 family)
MKLHISAILFDLGGVLVNWDGIEPLRNLTQGKLSREDARRFWLESPWVRRFEVGGCGPDEFAAGVVGELGLTVAPEVFLSEFESWDRGPLPGAFELLERLQRGCPLYCLSNNNEIHWRKPALQGLLKFFTRTFVSFEIGVMKPDLAAFAYVLERVPERPGQILFLDDNPECITAAEQGGLVARRVSGVEGVKQVLADSRLTNNGERITVTPPFTAG